MVYPEQGKNRTFILTWEGASLNNKKIDLAVTDRIVSTVEDIKDDDKWQLIGNISTKEELENGKGFNYGGSQIFVQHKKVFWFIKELTLLVDSIKVKGNSWQDPHLQYS